jgi:hypothetical protein
VGGLVVAGAGVVLAAVVGGLVVGGLVVAGAGVVLAAVVGALVAGAPVAGGAAEVLLDGGAAVVEERARVAAGEAARVLDRAVDVGPVITELVEGSVGMVAPGTVPSVNGTDLVWKLTTAASPAIVAPTTIGARLTGLAPSRQPSA